MARRRRGSGHRQVGHLASPQPARRGAAAGALPQARGAAGGAGHQGGLVSRLAAGLPGRRHAGCGGHGRQRGGLRAAGRFARRERLSPAALREPGGERDPRPLLFSAGRLCQRRADLGPGGHQASEARDAVPGGSRLRRIRTLAPSGRNRGGLALARAQEHDPALPRAPGRRLLPEQALCVGEGPPPRPQGPLGGG